MGRGAGWIPDDDSQEWIYLAIDVRPARIGASLWATSWHTSGSATPTGEKLSPS